MWRDLKENEIDVSKLLDDISENKLRIWILLFFEIFVEFEKIWRGYYKKWYFCYFEILNVIILN